MGGCSVHCRIFSSLLRFYLLAAILLQLWWSKNVLDLGGGDQILTSWGLLIQKDLKKIFLLLLKNGFLNRWIHKSKCVLLFLLQRKNLATCSFYLSSKFSFIQNLINLMHGKKKSLKWNFMLCIIRKQCNYFHNLLLAIIQIQGKVRDMAT